MLRLARMRTIKLQYEVCVRLRGGAVELTCSIWGEAMELGFR